MARPLTMSADLFFFARQAIRGRQLEAVSGYLVKAARRPGAALTNVGPDWLKHTMARLKQYELTLIQFSLHVF